MDEENKTPGNIDDDEKEDIEIPLYEDFSIDITDELIQDFMVGNNESENVPTFDDLNKAFYERKNPVTVEKIIDFIKDTTNNTRLQRLQKSNLTISEETHHGTINMTQENNISTFPIEIKKDIANNSNKSLSNEVSDNNSSINDENPDVQFTLFLETIQEDAFELKTNASALKNDNPNEVFIYVDGLGKTSSGNESNAGFILP